MSRFHTRFLGGFHLLGDLLLTLAGGNRARLNRWGVDRNYYVGLGFSLLLSATIGSVSLTVAANIIWGLTDGPLAVVGLVYFVLILGFDRWLVSDATSGFSPTQYSNYWSRSFGWVGNFLIETLKILPRVIIASLTSLLFAEILLLTIFGTEIHEQMKVDQLAASADYTSKVSALANSLAAPQQKVIDEAEKRKETLQSDLVAATAAVAAAETTRQSGLRDLAAAGVSVACWDYTVNRFDAAGRLYPVRIQGCPQQVELLNEAYDNAVRPYKDLNQQSVDTKKSDIDNEAGVRAARDYVQSGAKTEAENQLKSTAPQTLEDAGLLLRMKALEQLTTPSPANCVNPTVSSTSTATPPSTGTQQAEASPNAIEPCHVYYSASAALQKDLWRWVIFAFEISAVVLKLVRSITKKTGHAAFMSAVDDEAHAEALIRRARSKSRLHHESVRAEEEALLAINDAVTEKEIHLRANARARERYRLRAMLDRFHRADRPDPKQSASKLPDVEDALNEAFENSDVSEAPREEPVAKKVIRDDDYLLR
ncbi:DUF4407 domain-containing protein [Arthrobacter sp. MMS24-T111]